MNSWSQRSQRSDRVSQFNFQPNTQQTPLTASSSPSPEKLIDFLSFLHARQPTKAMQQYIFLRVEGKFSI